MVALLLFLHSCYFIHRCHGSPLGSRRHVLTVLEVFLDLRLPNLGLLDLHHISRFVFLRR